MILREGLVDLACPAPGSGTLGSFNLLSGSFSIGIPRGSAAGTKKSLDIRPD